MNFDLERYYDYIWDETKVGLENFIEQCQSEIEKRFILEMIYGISQNFRYWYVYEKNKTFIFSSNWNDYYELNITPQKKIGKYVVDFYAEIVERKTDFVDLKTVIECDGHEFHEKTKEKVKQDNERTRQLTRMGYKVFRFSGHEIYSGDASFEFGENIGKYMRGQE